MVGCSNKPYTEKDSGKTVELSIDSEFEVQLNGKPDAGYEWRVVGLENSIVELIGQPEIVTAKEANAETGTYAFTFKNKSAGNATIRIIYFNKLHEDPVLERVFEMKVVSGMMGQIEE